tara:strand:- start:866 stop:1180 length:315 start_codon:yes stop_codon:yes gene_type:complete
MTYYSRQKEPVTLYNMNPAEHEINFLARDMIARDIGGNGNSISDMVFWYGRSPALIRHVIEVALPKMGYHLEYEIWFDFKDQDDPEDYQPSQKIDICVTLKGEE